MFARSLGDGNEEFTDSMRYVFDFNGSLHSYHYEDADLERNLQEKRRQEEWRINVKEGDQIDAIKGDYKCKAWGVATVVETDGNGYVNVEFRNENPFYDRKLLIFGSEVA